MIAFEQDWDPLPLQGLKVCGPSIHSSLHRS